jgi:hypothetical protein
MRRWHKPLDPACPAVARFMDALFNDPMTDAMGAPTDEIVEALREEASPDLRALPRVRRDEHRGGVMRGDPGNPSFAGCKVHCGDVVREREGRHEAVVLAIFHGTVRVRWCDTGWKSDLPFDTVEVVERVSSIAAMVAPERPATVVESPRRQLERWFAEQAAKKRGT